MEVSVRLTATILGLLALLAATYFGALTTGTAEAQLATGVTVTKSCQGPAPDFDFTLERTGPPGTPAMESITCGENFTLPLDAAAEYDLTEADADGWELTTPVSCTGDTGVVITQISGGVHIVTPAGDVASVACTFENTATTPPAGSVVVTKSCQGPAPDFDFTLERTGPPGTPAMESITCGENFSLPLDAAAEYDLTEADVDGWALTTPVTCIGGDGVVVTQITGGVHIVTPAGAAATVACTFVNTETTPRTGSITVVKNANGVDEDFDFSISASGSQPCEDTNFVLNDGSGATDSETFNDCTAGVTYTIAETNMPGNWDLTDIDCNGGSPSYGGTSVQITLDPGEDVTCTFYNDPVRQTGSIRIIKDTNPETNSPSFHFNGDLGAFNLYDNDSETFSSLSAGDYTVTENEPAGWVLADIQCDSNDVSFSGNSVTIDLASDDYVTCTFINEPSERGSITIIKDTNPETSGIYFSFGGDLGSFSLADNGSQTFTGLGAGTYVVTENEPSGWNLVDIICNGSYVTYSGNSAVIDLAYNEHVTCTFVNDPTTFITPTPPVIIVATATPTPPVIGPTTGPIAPPSAGDGGLLPTGGTPWVAGVLSIIAASGVAWLFLQRMLRRTDQR